MCDMIIDEMYDIDSDHRLHTGADMPDSSIVLVRYVDYTYILRIDEAGRIAANYGEPSAEHKAMVHAAAAGATVDMTWLDKHYDIYEETRPHKSEWWAKPNTIAILAAASV